MKREEILSSLLEQFRRDIELEKMEDDSDLLMAYNILIDNLINLRIVDIQDKTYFNNEIEKYYRHLAEYY